MAIIVLDKIKKSYGRHVVLEDFSLEIEQGELVAIMGPSGCGKSTMLNIIGLLEDIDSGNIVIDGFVNPRPSTVLSNGILRRCINYLFQNFALVDHKNVEFNLRLALETQKGSRKDKERAIDAALERVDLKGYRKYKIFEMSAGEQQRVAMARALLKPCEIVLADEPTGSLDPQNRDAILSMLKEMNEQGKTVLIATHDPVVGRECKRVVTFGSKAEG